MSAALLLLSEPNRASLAVSAAVPEHQLSDGVSAILGVQQVAYFRLGPDEGPLEIRKSQSPSAHCIDQLLNRPVGRLEDVGHQNSSVVLSDVGIGGVE